jgi:hypothetical protein
MVDQQAINGFLQAYFRNCLAAPNVRDHARKILKRMISDADTKKPMPVAALSTETQRSREQVLA